MDNPLLARLGVRYPVIQAPMAGVSTPALAAAVSKAGGLGSIGVGAVAAPAAREMIRAIRDRTAAPFNVNLFCHRPSGRDPAREAAWLARLRPAFAALGAEPPAALREIYASFLNNEAMLAMLLEERPPVVSFHFGLPDAARLAALRDAGITLLATATSPREAAQAEAAGVHALVAQGIEAGGHRGVFDGLPDELIGTFALVRLLVRQSRLPVVAAGGIMDGAGVAAALRLGAAAAQLGTAFIACPESSASPGHRAALVDGRGTVVTAAISGRPARGLENRFTAEFGAGEDAPGYPFTYDAGKALHQAAMARGEEGYAAWWAGQGAPLARAMPAAALVDTLVREAGLEG